MTTCLGLGVAAGAVLFLGPRRVATNLYHGSMELMGMRSGTGAAEAAPEDGATKLPASRSVDDVLRLCGAKTKTKFAPLCAKAGIAYPPARIRLLAFKQERMMEVWGANSSGAFHPLATYSIKAASGHLGPKSREGDRQVPEGFYKLDSLNPNSRFHVSIRVDYPNAADVAANPGIPPGLLGSDIYVHGKNASIGCLAMGDVAIEDIFCLAAQTTRRDILILPVDPRHSPMPPADEAYLQKRYAKLSATVKAMDAAARGR